MNLRITYQRTDSLIEYANNPRDNDHAVGKMAAAIREYDCVVPLLIKSDLSVVDGHLRLKAARKLQLEELPCIFVDHLSDVQIKALRISINKMAEVADWDETLLALEIDALKDAEYDLSILGFDQDELDALVDAASTEDSGADDVPDVSAEEPRTRLGDVWLCGAHRVMCGDSTDVKQVERLMGGELVDMVHADPPYGMNAVSRSPVLRSRYKKDILGDSSPDVAKIAFDVFETLYPDCSQIWWGANYYSSVLPDSECWIVWDKNTGGSDQTDCELAWSNLRSVVRQFTKASDKVNRVHPTQKPVTLIEWILDLSKTPDRGFCVDPFLGSGTTLIACEKTGRRCFGMELDPKYCDVIVKRWQDYTGEQAVLEATGETFNGS